LSRRWGGICAGLVGNEIPLAVGWTASIDDELATGIAATFYETRAAGQPVDRALTQARQSVRRQCEARDDPSWTLPVLYAATTQDRVVDPDLRRPSVQPSRRTTVQRPLPGMIEGYANQVVGRRREIQRLLPPLRDGALQCVLITGLAGAGKSTLATRLARALEGDSFIPIPVSSTIETPLSAARLLESCADVFLAAGLRAEHDMLQDPTLAPEVRLRQIVAALNRHRFTLVLDNLEVNLDEGTRRFVDNGVGLFYEHLLTHLSGESRALITSRYRPAEVAMFPPTAQDLPLGDFAEVSFFKILLRDPAVARRYETGDLSHTLLAEVYRLLGGTPRFIAQIREILRTVATDDLLSELAAVSIPPGADTGRLQDTRDRYCERIVAARLYAALGPRARRALSRAAVVGVPVPLDGLAAVSGVQGDEMVAITREWQDYALAYREGDENEGERWTVYGVLRGWLLAPTRLPEDERRSAHRAAGEYLEGVVAGRRRDFGLSWGEIMLEARAQYRAAAAHDRARGVTDRLCIEMLKWGLYEDIVRLNQELLADEAHPAPMVWIARTHFERGAYHSAREWSLRSCDASDDTMPLERARAWHSVGSADIELGEYAAARASLERALPIYQQLGERAFEAGIWHQLGAIDLHEGHDGAARRSFETSLDIKRAIGAAVGEADTLWMLAILDLNKGDRSAARAKVDLALQIRQRIGDHAGEAIARHGLASVSFSERRYEAARADFKQALDIDRSIGARGKEAATLHQLAIIDFELGDIEAARAGFQAVLKMRQESGNRADESLALYDLARIDLRDGETAAARSKLVDALDIQRAIGHRVGQAMTLYSLAMVDIAEGAHLAARANLRASLDIRRNLGVHMGDAAVWCELAKLDLRTDDGGAAWDNFMSALEVARENDDVSGEASALSGLATVAHGRGDAAKTRALFEQALEIRRRIGDRPGEAEILHALALVAMSNQDYDAAFHKMLAALAIRRGVGEVMGEASTFHDLALLAHKVGREAQAWRLGALSFILECRARRSTNTNTLLAKVASYLGCTKGDILDVIIEATEAYEADKGEGLAQLALQ